MNGTSETGYRNKGRAQIGMEMESDEGGKSYEVLV